MTCSIHQVLQSSMICFTPSAVYIKFDAYSSMSTLKTALIYVCRCRAHIAGREILEERLNEVMQTQFPDKHGIDIKTGATQEAHALAIKLVRAGSVSGEPLEAQDVVMFVTTLKAEQQCTSMASHV